MRRRAESLGTTGATGGPRELLGRSTKSLCVCACCHYLKKQLDVTRKVCSMTHKEQGKFGECVETRNGCWCDRVCKASVAAFQDRPASAWHVTKLHTSSYCIMKRRLWSFFLACEPHSISHCQCVPRVRCLCHIALLTTPLLIKVTVLWLLRCSLHTTLLLCTKLLRESST